MNGSGANSNLSLLTDEFEATPALFLDVRVKRLDLDPSLVALCAGYEAGEWRSTQFADHILEWLPEFALSYSERRSLKANSAVRLIRATSRSIYSSNKFKNRGEFGELLLHIAIRQVFATIPAISKIYYKDSTNETVKGFDAVHIIASDSSLELWLGESKLYSRISQAISDVVEELHIHSGNSYLRSEFAAIVNKIDPKWPYAERLAKLLDPNTSLDSIFDAACFPVLLTYDSETVNSYDRICQEYAEAFAEEVGKNYDAFCAKVLPPIRIHLFLLPLKSKKELVEKLDSGLRKWQNI
jgi:hypothetical protein